MRNTTFMLTPSQRQDLRGQAHALKPVVMIGDKGLVDTVMAEIDRALKVHELIKIRVMSEEREDRAAAMAQICKSLNTEPVQIIGKLLVVYRQRTEEETADRARMQVDRAKRARIRLAAKQREEQAKLPARTAPARSPARSPKTTPREDGNRNRGVNPKVTRGSVQLDTQRAPRPTTRAAPARPAQDRAAAPRRTAGARTTRPPRKAGY